MRVGFIGAGQMARALAGGFVARGLVGPTEIVAADCAEGSRASFQAALPQAEVVVDNRQVVEQCELIFLSVKPQHLESVCAPLTPVPAGKLFVSIAAGVSLARLTSLLGTQRIVRVMPNTPALIGEGASVYCRGADVTDADARQVAELLGAVGMSFELPEAALDAVTGLSGSGPAYVYLFIEALADGGVRMGLPRSIALQLAAQTVRGAAGMVLNSDTHPALLKDQVTSPGGTTIAGLHVLESGGLRGLVMSAVQQATERSQQLGRPMLAPTS